MIYLIVQAKDLEDVPDPPPLSLSSILSPSVQTISKSSKFFVSISFRSLYFSPSTLPLLYARRPPSLSPGILHWPHKWYSYLESSFKPTACSAVIAKSTCEHVSLHVAFSFKYGLQKASTSPNLPPKPLSTLYSIGWTS